MASANAYLGADVVAQALATDAEVVITGRVADPSLFLGTAMYHHGWSYDDWPRLAAGTVAGHLLECSTQVTGGYFADPGKKDVPDLANLAYPFADVAARRQRRHRQAAGLGRARRPHDLHGADPLRDPRSGALHHARLRGRPERTRLPRAGRRQRSRSMARRPIRAPTSTRSWSATPTAISASARSPMRASMRSRARSSRRKWCSSASASKAASRARSRST